MDTYWASLKKRDYYGIILYLSIIHIFSVGMLIATYVFNYKEILDMILSVQAVFLKGIFVETSINSMYYLRKIYKKSISNEIMIVDSYDSLRSKGVILYFISRPIFGVLFYLFASIFFIDFIQSIAVDISNVNGTLTPWIILLGIYVGHMTGNIIDLFHDKTEKISRLTN